MAAAPSSPTTTTETTRATMITDLNEDSLAHCANYLSLQDLSNLAMTCKSLKRIAYSDSIWNHWLREHWPKGVSCTLFQASGAREAYLQRRVAVQQFRFHHPLSLFYTMSNAKPFDHLLLDKGDIIFSQESVLHMVPAAGLLDGKAHTTLKDHKARITCMRLFPLDETFLSRSKAQGKESVLVTSSCDHSIRLWWKGSCQRCFRGHNGPVLALSDKLLGDGSAKVFASGGEDRTVRLWSIKSSGKRGQRALEATLYGHEKPVKLMSVAGHRTSLLVTISKDSKVRVWDTTTSSSVRSSCYVGMTSVPGAPVDMKCHESLVFVAAGSSVVTIDLRTMQKVITGAICQPKLYSFAIMPSKSLICTGGNDKAMLWDIRRNQERLKPDPIAELDGHTGPVTQLHMDPYKIVTGGPEDTCINVWEADTGAPTNSLICFPLEDAKCSAMNVRGTQIVTAGYTEEEGFLCFRDFFNATCPVLKHEDAHASKFWDPGSYSDADSDTDNQMAE